MTASGPAVARGRRQARQPAMRSHLLHGKVRHRRLQPVEYELEHDVFYLALDLTEIDAVAGKLRLLSRNRANVLSFRDGDHWLPPAADLAASVEEHLRDEGFDPQGWRITFIATPRIFGYQFNPASFYLCRDRARRAARLHHRGAQHARRATPLHAAAGASRIGLGRRHGQGLLRLAIHRHGCPLHGARPG